MKVERVADAGAFLDRTRALLLADEARHNLLLGLAETIRSDVDRYPERRFWLVSDRGRAVAAALQTPPYNLVLARPATPGALAALTAGLPAEIPGVIGALPEVEEFASL